MPKAKQHVTLDGRIVPVSNLGKILFPVGSLRRRAVFGEKWYSEGVDTVPGYVALHANEESFQSSKEQCTNKKRKSRRTPPEFGTAL